MIVRKILNYCKETPEKVAISYHKESWNYGQLQSKILKRASFFANDKNESFLLVNNHPFEIIVDYLACSLTNKKLLIGHSSLIAQFESEFKVIDKWDDIDNNLFFVQKDSFKSTFQFGIVSSGSTGIPKPIWKTNENWESAFEHQSQVFKVDQRDTLFVLNALTYSANLNAVLHQLWCGGTVALQSLKHASHWGRKIEEDKITSIFLVPSHWQLLLKSEEVHFNVKSCVSAGEKLSSLTAKEILSHFPETCLTEYYGAAELGHITFQQNKDIVDNPFAVGKPFPGVKLEIKDQKIYVQSSYVAEEFKSGTVSDLGYLEDGKLILLGREGRMYNKRGLNVFAQEIEQTLLLHPFIEECTLQELDYSGNNKLVLFYSCKQELNEGKIWEFLNQKLSKDKHPHFLKKVRQFDHNTHGKIDRGQLMKKLDEEAAVFA